jgi:hypothetical protein
VNLFIPALDKKQTRALYAPLQSCSLSFHTRWAQSASSFDATFNPRNDAMRMSLTRNRVEKLMHRFVHHFPTHTDARRVFVGDSTRKTFEATPCTNLLSTWALV